ncbi:carboxypeptidase-like regulatory domain-containing protein [Brenneria goodwinii]|uniref:carboxypeptidase-like regulatory domain-containing protein n=1 Tax=Brenneria goodwinii TaxID=1109412 RepID=UPI0036EC7F93
MAVTTHTAIISGGGAFTDSIPGEGKFTAVATTVLTTPGGTQLTVTSNPVTIAANYDVSIAFVDDGNGVITGALTGEAGTVVSNVTVILTLTDANGNVTIIQTVTDSFGNFSYTLLTPGNYTVTASATVNTPLGESKNIASDELDVNYVLPGEGDITLSAEVKHWGAYAIFSGTVTASEWLSVSGRDVILEITGDGNSYTVIVTTDGDGNYSYEFDSAGTYFVVASCVISDALTVVSPAVTFDIADVSNTGTHAGILEYEIDFTAISELPGAASTYVSTAANDFTRITSRNITYSLSDDGLTLAKSSNGQTAGVLYFDDIIASDFVATFDVLLNTNGVIDSATLNQNVMAGLHFRSASKNIFGWRALLSRHRSVVTQATTQTNNTAAGIVTFDNQLDYSRVIHGRIEARGINVSLYINNTLAQTYSRSVTNVSGYIGLFYSMYDSSRNQNAVFKNLRVYEYVN